MFHLLKFIVWLAGIMVIAYLTLPFFGYELNLGYFKESKLECQKRLTACTTSIATKGNNSGCDFVCVDPKLIIKKQ